MLGIADRAPFKVEGYEVDGHAVSIWRVLDEG